MPAPTSWTPGRKATRCSSSASVAAPTRPGRCAGCCYRIGVLWPGSENLVPYAVQVYAHTPGKDSVLTRDEGFSEPDPPAGRCMWRSGGTVNWSPVRWHCRPRASSWPPRTAWRRRWPRRLRVSSYRAPDPRPSRLRSATSSAASSSKQVRRERKSPRWCRDSPMSTCTPPVLVNGIRRHRWRWRGQRGCTPRDRRFAAAYNQADPELPGLIVCRPEYAEAVLRVTA